MIDALLALDWPLVGEATVDTLLMLAGSLLFTLLFGLPLGTWLMLSAPGQMLERPRLYRCLSLLVNVIRSFPFVILMILMIPLTELLFRTSIGVMGTIPPLVVAATPFLGRLVESALREVDRGIIEAMQGMGATTWQIIRHGLLPEARPSLIAAVTVTAITLISYTAMSGLVGGGGLGDLAVRYGYHRYQFDMMMVNVLLLLILVQGLQTLGDLLVRRYSRK